MEVKAPTEDAVVDITVVVDIADIFAEEEEAEVKYTVQAEVKYMVHNRSRCKVTTPMRTSSSELRLVGATDLKAVAD